MLCDLLSPIGVKSNSQNSSYKYYISTAVIDKTGAIEYRPDRPQRFCKLQSWNRNNVQVNWEISIIIIFSLTLC